MWGWGGGGGRGEGGGEEERRDMCMQDKDKECTSRISTSDPETTNHLVSIVTSHI